MAKFRKKPVIIEAFLWTGGPDQTEDPEWCCDAIRAGTVRFENVGTPQVALLIDTLEGTHRANVGDWIIRGIKGELYPCKPDIFSATYDPVAPPGDAEKPEPSGETCRTCKGTRQIIVGGGRSGGGTFNPWIDGPCPACSPRSPGTEGSGAKEEM